MEASPAPQPDHAGDAPPTQLTEAGANPQATAEAPTAQLVGATVGDRCATCGAPLASDQSYCLNCGERRGKARFSFASMTAPKAAAAPPRRRDPRRPRFSSSATLVAGIGTLLLAMGVGVLIGDLGKNNKATPAAATPQVITVQGGAGGGTAASTTSTPGATNTPSGTHSHSSTKATKHAAKASAPKTVVITKKVAAKATAAATKVLGGNNLASNATSTVGSACGNGQAGCQNGKFTGNFFGGG